MNSDYETACENDRILKAALIPKYIIMIIHLVAVIAGVILFIIYKIGGEHIIPCILSMLLVWAFGSISSIFDRDSWIRRYLRKLVELLGRQLSKDFPVNIMGIPFFIIGAIFGFTFGGIYSPVVIVMCLIGIGKVNKQIADNNKILSQFRAENSQNKD